MNKREYSEMVIGNRTVDELLHLYLTDQITDNPTYVAVTALLRKAVIREASVETCEWKENEDGMWDTSCENTFVFDEGGPEENEQKFCCYCGKPLKVVPFVYPTEEETT